MSQPTTPNPHDYLADHLYNELRYLLCAATEWLVQETIPDPVLGGDYVQVYAMDSAALHGRALFEFLTKASTGNHLGLNLYGLQPILLTRYLVDWQGPMHSHLLHLQDRTVGHRLTSFDGSTTRDLNEMPVDFGREVVRLWRQFIADLQAQSNPLAPLAQSTLADAIAESALVIANERNAPHGIAPIVW